MYGTWRMAVPPIYAFSAGKKIESEISLKMFVAHLCYPNDLESPILLLISVIQPGELCLFLLYGS